MNEFLLYAWICSYLLAVFYPATRNVQKRFIFASIIVGVFAPMIALAFVGISGVNRLVKLSIKKTFFALVFAMLFSLYTMEIIRRQYISPMLFIESAAITYVLPLLLFLFLPKDILQVMIRLSPSVAMIGLVVSYGKQILHVLPDNYYFLSVFMSSNACLLLIEKGVEVRKNLIKKQISSHYLEQLKKQA